MTVFIIEGGGTLEATHEESTNHLAESHLYVISNGPITCPLVEEKASKEANCLMLLAKFKGGDVATLRPVDRSLLQPQLLPKLTYRRNCDSYEGMSDSYQGSSPAG